ncbi:MAG TPA: FCD domain-containing protein [Pseudolabrys sp.]|jgi:DNA-binding FadR family transcriptional regulator|nr:FCD domain-containing protein [Pseudolabrys sp.]
MIKDVDAAQVRRFVLNAIEEEQLPEGAKLPTERSLVERLNVSRSAVRNALAALETEGRIRRRVGSGTFVALQNGHANNSQNVPEFSPRQLIEARIAVEPQIASLAAINATKVDFERLEECARAYHRADTVIDFDIADATFHATIARATNNPLIIRIYQEITIAQTAADWGGLRHRFLTSSRRIASRVEHDKILEALRMRDSAKAIEAVRFHLHEIAAALLR